jgi:hypothetical protein
MGPKPNKGIPSGKTRNWCFTIPFDAEGCEEQLRRLREDPGVVVLCVGEEIGDETGYHHWQGCVRFANEKSGTQCKQKLVKEAHIEKAESTLQKCIEYCSKQHKVKFAKNVHNYKPIERKQKEDKQEIWRTILKDAETMEPDEFKEKWPREWILRRSAIERIMVESSARTAKTWNGNLQHKNFWVYGEPGIGKSRWATQQIAPWNTLRKNNNKWWCGFSCTNTRLVILEDYPGLPQGDALQHHMKVWADRYPFLGEIKGGGVTIETGRWALIITSNYAIDECFSKEQDRKALHRRFNEIQMTRANATLIENLKIDFEILHQKRKTDGKDIEQQEEEMDDAAIEDLQNHLEEVEAMQHEAKEREEQGLDLDEEW